VKSINHNVVTDADRRMTDEEVWAGYARAAISGAMSSPEMYSIANPTEAADLCANAADAMLAEHRKRFPGEG